MQVDEDDVELMMNQDDDEVQVVENHQNSSTSPSSGHSGARVTAPAAQLPFDIMETQRMDPTTNRSPPRQPQPVPVTPPRARLTPRMSTGGRRPPRSSQRNVMRAPSSPAEESDEVNIIEEPAAENLNHILFKNELFDKKSVVKREQEDEDSDEEIKLIVGRGPKKSIISVAKDLLANYPYFWTHLREQQNEIVLPEMSRLAVTKIKGYLSEGQMLIPESIPQIKDLMKAAMEIHMDPISDKCAEILKKMITIENWLQLRQVAAELINFKLAIEVNEFIRTNFHQIYNQREILQLDFHGFLEILQVYNRSKKDLNHSLVYKAVVQWVKEKEGERKAFLPRLMKQVELKEVLKKGNLKKQDFDVLREECSSLYMEALEHYCFSRDEPQPSTSRAALRRGAATAAEFPLAPAAGAKRIKTEPQEEEETQASSRPRAVGRPRGGAAARGARKSAPPSRPQLATARRTPKPPKATGPRAPAPLKASPRPVVVRVPQIASSSARQSEAAAAVDVPEAPPAPAPEGLKLLYSLKQNEETHLFTYDFTTGNCLPSYRIRENVTLSSVLVVGDKIYHMGGTLETLDPSTSSDSGNVEIFQKGKMDGTQGPPMKHERKEFGACVLRDAIYVIGGCEGDEAMNCVERLKLNPENNSGGGGRTRAKSAWEKRDFLNSRRGALGAATLGDRIFAVGGIGSPKQSRAIVEVYNPETNKWTNGKNLTVGRGYLSVITMNEKLYAAGGEVPRDGRGSKIVESYDAHADTWMNVSSMHHARCEFGLVAFEGALYAIGGDQDKKRPSMERYDPREGVWKIIEWPQNLHKDASFLACAVAP